MPGAIGPTGSHSTTRRVIRRLRGTSFGMLRRAIRGAFTDLTGCAFCAFTDL